MLARLPQRESSLCECDITGAITFRTATPRCPPGSTNQPRVTGRLDIVLRLSAFGRTLRLLPSAGPLRRIYSLRTKNPDLDYLLRGTVHVRGSSPIQELRGDLATATARALRLYGSG
jgi:hypothetical protein